MAFGESLKNFFVGQPGQQMQFNRFTPQQQGLQNQSIQQILSLLQGGGAEGIPSFAPIAQRAQNNFQTQTVPMLAERFASLGSNKRSSGLEGQIFGAGKQLEEGLAGLESQHGLSLLNLLLGLAAQPSFENAYRPSQPGFFQGVAGGLGQGLGTLGSLAPLQYLGLL